MKRIIVGTDGSPGSQPALRWAAEEAALRNAQLDVVAAWQPAVVLNPYPYGPVPMPLDQEVEAATKHRAEKALADAGIASGPEHRVTIVTREGPAAPALLEAARGADLLVVGSRGYGAFKGMLLGSVGHHCVAHAPCPVVVVPPSIDIHKRDSRSWVNQSAPRSLS